MGEGPPRVLYRTGRVTDASNVRIESAGAFMLYRFFWCCFVPGYCSDAFVLSFSLPLLCLHVCAEDCFISMDPAKIVLQKHTRTNQKNRLPHTPNYQRTTDADSLELHRTRIEYYEPKTGRNESNFLAAADGLQLVREGGYAFHVAISAAYRIIRLTFSEREICELSEIDMFPVWSQWMVAIVQKNSPYRDVITYG